MMLNDLNQIKETELAARKKNRPALLSGRRMRFLQFERR